MAAGLLVTGCAAALFAIRNQALRDRSPAASTEATQPQTPPSPATGHRISPEAAAGLAALTTREQAADEQFWSAEKSADTCGQVLEQWWDRLRAATNRLELAAQFPAREWVAPRWQVAVHHPHGITEFRPATNSPTATASNLDWPRTILGLAEQGWILTQTEFRHTRFDTNASGQPDQSTFEFRADLVRAAPVQRAHVVGDLIVGWSPATTPGDSPTIARLDASHLILRSRDGAAPFRLILEEVIAPPPHGQSVDPLILHDLDGDGLSEIVLAGRNLVYRRAPDGGFSGSALLQHPADVIYAAVMADFDNDGHADFLGLTSRGLELWRGSADGRFPHRGEIVWSTVPTLPFPMVLSCGDLDHDGDIDLFLGQYKDPYEGGATPTPYFDARNGNPCFLLRNDGGGRFADITESAGLQAKRGRRIYSASFVDLDGDGHLDLVTASDFAGLDLFRNDGRGRFTDITASAVPDPHGFGMAHALSDFDADGRLDVLMIGMTSPTVDRLRHLGLQRPGLPGGASMMASMAHGNRLLLRREPSTWTETELSRSIQRSGWSWGCGVGDLDNDGWPDVYVGNGLESKQTVREYECEYWLHDLYVGGADADPAAYLYFREKYARTRGRGQSYGGFEKNRLFLNLGGRSFVESGHLLGVALEADSRNVALDDLDGDGRLDLLVVSFESWPSPRQTLRVYRNELEQPGNWIGFRFDDEPRAGSPIGVQVRIDTPRGKAVRTVVTGDSYRSQSASTVHFGLGQEDSRAVERVTVRWPGGPELVLKNKAANQYHTVRRPSP